MSTFGAAIDAALEARFATYAPAAMQAAGDVRAGFVFGPRALRRWLGRFLPLPVSDGDGKQRRVRGRFDDTDAIARFLVDALNQSLARAYVQTRLQVGATARLADDEAQPRGPHPGAWLADLIDGRVATKGGAMPLECWAAAARVNCVFVLVDWQMSRTRIEHGFWAGFAPREPVREHDGLRFTPVLIADLRCALTAHTAAHEFGHVMGCGHDDAANLLAPRARGFARSNTRFSLMAAARPRERGRHLEWTRPAPGGGVWDFGDADHDEASWLGTTLPQLARRQFRCAGFCGGLCGARPAARALQPTDVTAV